LAAARRDKSISCYEDDEKCQVSDGNMIKMIVETQPGKSVRSSLIEVIRSLNIAKGTTDPRVEF